MRINPETLQDAYKAGHRNQYVPGIELVFSNMTPRKTYRKGYKGKVIFFGLQYFIKEYLIKQWNENFFSQPKEKVLARFERRINNYLGKNQIGTQHISDLHDLQHIPLTIMALKEGTSINYKVAPFVFWSTDKRFAWFTNYIETIMSTTIWPLSTTATSAKQFRDILEKYALETVGNTDFVKFCGHNFSYRGCVGHEAAIMIDAGWLTSFCGSDSIPGVDFIEEYYNGDSDKELISCSVNATEHSVMASYGKEDELEAFRRIIQDVYPTGIVSIVSDTFDYWSVISSFTVKLKDIILARDGKTVFRPDSGDNVKIIIGEDIINYSNNQYITDLTIAKEYAKDDILDKVRENTPHGESGDYEVTKLFKFQDKAYKIVVQIDWNRYDKQYYYIDGSSIKSCEEVQLSAEQKGTIESLWEIFGGNVNEKGYKELNPKVGAILGDGVSLDVMNRICEGLKKKGFASTNLVYGVGSYSLVYGVSRDSDGWAVKSTYCEVSGQPREIFKDPLTDKDNLKKSAKGLISVFKDENGEYIQKDHCSWNEVKNCEYELVFEDSKLIRDQNFNEIRALINNKF